MLIVLLLVSLAVLALAYRFYGAFLCRRCGVDDTRKTPAVTHEDGVDYVPTAPSIVFGHHFSSIAGAGPIVGPILATAYFGWGPTLLWILVGSIFVGGVHDFGCIFMSLRNRGRTISEITHALVGRRTATFFRVFLILALIYIIIVFLDLTAATFAGTPAVATASGWFIVCAVAFGQVLRWRGLPYALILAIFIPLTFAGLALGHYLPADGLSKNTWLGIILAYCFVAAVMPVSWLLQPRDFLSSTFLYAMMLLGVVGLLLSGEVIRMPVFEGWSTTQVKHAGYLFPLLFITVACGACSGFHSMVASGTTSKQIRTEGDTRKVGYGAMLVEGLLAVFAMLAVAILSEADIGENTNPVHLFSLGASRFMASLGIPPELGAEFTALTVSTFLLTTLDTCTRLARFLLQEMFDWEGERSRYLGTLGVLVLPLLVAFQTYDGQPAWKMIWPLFGSTNQLMAALALVTLVVFLKEHRIAYRFALIPALFMLVTPLVYLGFMTANAEEGLFLRGVSLAMLLLGVYVAGMSLRFVLRDEEAA